MTTKKASTIELKEQLDKLEIKYKELDNIIVTLTVELKKKDNRLASLEARLMDKLSGSKEEHLNCKKL